MDDFDRILDECVDRINSGESLDACLGDYPDYIENLRSLLQTILKTKETYSFLPSLDAKRSARQRFGAALEELERRQDKRQTIFPWLLNWSGAWATVAVVLIIAVLGFFGMRSLMLPTGSSPESEVTTMVLNPQSNPEGNFVFLVSDDVNAISDFESVDISISRIGLTPRDSPNNQVEFEPEVVEVDLTLVPGDETQEIWRGNIPEGEYNKVFIEVSDVRGILKESGEEVEIKLPSHKLHISKQFQVATDTVTSFTYDLTVIAAGSSQSGIKYILKPQVDQSGAEQKPSKTEEKSNTDHKPDKTGGKSNAPGQNK